MNVTVILIVIGVLGTIAERFTKKEEDFETSGDHPDSGIVEIDQNAEKCLRDLLSIKVKINLLMLVWKNLKRKIMIIIEQKW